MSERELFNEWIKHYEKHDVKIDQLQRAFMWQAWQASANRQGYKLVPVDEAHENESYNSFQGINLRPNY